MKPVRGIVAVALAAAAFSACDKDPVGENADPQLVLSPDSVVVGVFDSSPLTAAIFNATGVAQYVSRDQGVATVNANGAVSGVAAGSTYVVATLTGRPDVRDSVRVRVHADSCSGARPDFGVATAADRALFSYDVDAPLNLQKTLVSTSNGVESAAFPSAARTAGW